MANDIGTPPNIEKAEKLQEELQLDIAIMGPNTNYVSTNFEIEKINNKFRSKKLKKLRTSQIQLNGYNFFFQLNHDHEGHWPTILFSLALMLLVLIASYHFVKKIFHPLRELEQAAQNISKGEFRISIKNKGRGELLRLSQTIENMSEKLEKQFETMRELLRGISHEVRSPLARMKLALEMIPQENAKTTINSLKEDIDQIDEMTFQLLETERLKNNPNELRLEKTRIDKLITQSANAIFQKSDEYELDIKEVTAHVDPSRFTLLVRNLLENAKKYRESQPVLIELKTEKTGFQLKIQNDGKGFHEKVLKNFGQPYLRVESARDKSRGGFGLGLSLCRSIVEAHCGEITLENKNAPDGLSRVALVRISFPFK